jgi:hypothetical protein
MYAFIVIAVVLVTIYCITDQSEGFKSKLVQPNVIPPTPCPTGSSTVPVTINRSIDANAVKPYSMPSDLPVAGYQQIGAMSPLPYQDTTMIKANRQQLVSLLEMVKGFLAFEAQEISEKSDPSIQLPLQTARSDYHVLQREVDVQNRNPGVQSTITLTSLNEMSSNLAYLQQQVRLTGSAGTLQGPINEFDNNTNEGFQSSRQPDGPVATKNDLKEFVGRIQGEIIRLSASGTNDPILTSRVNALTNMKSSIQQLIDKLTAGTLMASEVPVMKNAIDKALPILGKPGEPLPQVIKTLGLPPGLANALPSSLKKDPQTMQQVNTLLDKYADQIIKGVSASFAISYTSPNDAAANSAHNAAIKSTSTIDHTGFPSSSDLGNISNTMFMPMGGDTVSDPLAATPMDAGRGPKRIASHFDWKQRSKEIEDQVKKRGLRPSDFGIDTKLTSADRSKDFSWKGYAKMICTRLQATMDPALPETCGCPPMDWKGWR